MPTSLPEYGTCTKCEKREKLRGKADNRVMAKHLWRPKKGAPQEQCPGSEQPPKAGTAK